MFLFHELPDGGYRLLLEPCSAESFRILPEDLRDLLDVIRIHELSTHEPLKRLIAECFATVTYDRVDKIAMIEVKWVFSSKTFKCACSDEMGHGLSVKEALIKLLHDAWLDRLTEDLGQKAALFNPCAPEEAKA